MSNLKEETIDSATKPKAKTAFKRPKFGAKADFIRSMPETMTAKQVVAEAAKNGLKLTEGHVYNLRSMKKLSTKRIKSSARPKHLKLAGADVKSALVLDLEPRPSYVALSRRQEPTVDAAEALTQLIDSRIAAYFVSLANAAKAR